MKAREIRKRFTEYFTKNEHEKVSSSSLIPNNDPTLLFTNAGMNQFKDYFTGKETPKNKRASTIQKCVRAGGKHNDLENVGLTARHHTFFEMLGNFSFGDYFKEDAIQFAWKFLTEELKIPKEKLYVTHHYSDDEAKQIWMKKIGLSEDRIFSKGDKDNFWSMGDIGPCGPCSEIFYDHGPEFSDPNLKIKDNGDLLDDESRYVEIWNLVFMQYEKTNEGILDLPNPSIDTGAGLERIAAVMQGKYFNYDTDIFEPILKSISSLTGKKYSDEKYTTYFRIVADHIRSSVMLITDGVIPSNEGRGYVLRRIIRRAVRALNELNAPKGSFTKLIPSVFDTLGEEYPENNANKELANNILPIEESKFQETLNNGIKFLKEAIEDKLVNNKLPGDIAFRLYDTFGFPIDLTEVILKEKGIKLDLKGFNEFMEKQKHESKKSWKGGSRIDNKKYFDLKDKYGITNFIGYKTDNAQAKLLFKEQLGEQGILIFDSTPFYGESGGQCADTGDVLIDGNVLTKIIDVQKPVDNFFVHFCQNTESLEVGKEYTLEVNNGRRALIKKNHSATHLLQAALISVLGKHVKQSGSSVGPERLRFDFTHMKSLSEQQIAEVEKIVNSNIEKSIPVSTEILSKDEAIKRGAQALFGEKYGAEVRVVEMKSASLELCGGLHVSNTNEISHFSIISEGSLSTGIRRIEALTSSNSLNFLKENSESFKKIEQLVALKGTKAINQVSQIIQKGKDKSKEIEQLKLEIQQLKSKSMLNDTEMIKNIPFKAIEAPEGFDIRSLADSFINKYAEGIVLITQKSKDKKSILLKTNRKNPAVNVGKILKESLSALDGKGGGKPDMAQGSISVEKSKALIEIIRKGIKNAL